jgi:phage gpG-like protein
MGAFHKEEILMGVFKNLSPRDVKNLRRHMSRDALADIQRHAQAAAVAAASGIIGDLLPDTAGNLQAIGANRFKTSKSGKTVHVGFRPEFSHIAKHFRKQHRKYFSGHRSPGGLRWPKLEIKHPPIPIPKIGEPGPIRGTPADMKFVIIETPNQLNRSQRLWREMVPNWNPKGVKVPALYRKAGTLLSTANSAIARYYGSKNAQRTKIIRKASRLYTMMTKDRVQGSATRVEKFGMQYGLDGRASSWASIHQRGGGMFNGKPVAVRPFIGATKADLDEARNTINAAVAKHLREMTRKKITINVKVAV